MIIGSSSLTTAGHHNNHNRNHHQMERKLKKPLMEKKRRARINHCLVELKHILLQASPHQRTKLEKADILEMTVNHLRLKQSSECQTARQHYVDGYTQCSNAVLQYLNVAAAGTLDTNVRLGLMNHLSNSLLEKMKPSPTTTTATVSTGRIIAQTEQPKFHSGLIRPQPCIPLTLTIPPPQPQRSGNNNNQFVSHQQLPTPPFLQEPPNRIVVNSRDISPMSQSSSVTNTESMSFSPCSRYSTSPPSASDQEDVRPAKETSVWRPW